MKLLHITSSLNPAMGGVAEAVRSFISIAEQHPVLNEVVTLDAPGLNYFQSEKTPFHALGPSFGFLNHSRVLLLWLNENIERFDGIIINGLWSYHSYAAWKAIKKLKDSNSGKKIPQVFVMPHGMLDPYFQRAKERWLKSIRNDIYWFLIERKVINEADALLFTCETELILARETFRFYKPRKEYNVGFGIKCPPRFEANMRAAFVKACPSLGDEPYILFLGRIDSKKGVDLLIKSYIKLLKKAQPSGKKLPKLVVAGPGINTHFGEKLLHEIAENSGIDQQILFPGMLLDEAKWGAFYGCEAFVLPSHQENFGIAVVEALACSKPVIISNQVNIWREISLERGGIIDEDNIVGVENMLTKWVNLGKAEKLQMGINAFNAYRNYFMLDKTAKEMILTISKEVGIKCLVEAEVLN